MDCIKLLQVFWKFVSKSQLNRFPGPIRTVHTFTPCFTK